MDISYDTTVISKYVFSRRPGLANFTAIIKTAITLITLKEPLKTQ